MEQKTGIGYRLHPSRMRRGVKRSKSGGTDGGAESPRIVPSPPGSVRKTYSADLALVDFAKDRGYDVPPPQR
jgi:hypothetical protein